MTWPGITVNAEGRNEIDILTPQVADLRFAAQYAPVATGQAAALAALASLSKVIRLTPGATYAIDAPVALGAGTTIEGNGATIALTRKGSITLGDRSKLRDVFFVNQGLTGFVGGERCITIQGSGVEVTGCTLGGQGYRMGIVIEFVNAAGASIAGACDNVLIERNRFENTAFGVLKQGGPSSAYASAHGLRIIRNVFKTIRRGDAIELNAGADTGVLIDGNIIDDVTANNTVNAGFGIGVAGLGAYSAAESEAFRRFRIVNNIITNCEMQGIHAEKSAAFTITGNHVEQTSTTRKGTGQGIVTYGSMNGDITDNYVAGFDYGIEDMMGVTANAYTVATDRNRIYANRVRDCATGVLVELAGLGKSVFVDRNVLTDCAVGIRHRGSANTSFTGNQFIDCPTPFALDLNADAFANVAASARSLALVGNLAVSYKGVAMSNTYAHLAGAVISGSGNSFPLPSA
ncbi:right-handed parallel beta-helix repeat-containing protein [Clavibacter californiensis]|nr:right-handed parallel beta-helix repeat-containing protein [Clavibacter californiensis]